MKVVSTSNAPAAIGPYSQAIDLGNMVFVSGQIPVDPATGKMADTVEEQAAQSLANLKAILAEAGLSMANVVKTVIIMAVYMIPVLYFASMVACKGCNTR